MAVALGVGAAVATTPGIARADDGSSVSPGTAEPSSSDAADVVNGGSGVPSVAPAPDRVDSSASGSIAPDGPQEPTTGATTTITVGSAPPVTITSSGGANSSVGTEPSVTEIDSADDDEAEEIPDLVTAPASGKTPEAPNGGVATAVPTPGGDVHESASGVVDQVRTAVESDGSNAFLGVAGTADSFGAAGSTVQYAPAEQAVAFSVAEAVVSTTSTQSATPLVTPVVVTPIRQQPPGPFQVLGALPGALANAAVALVTAALAPLFAPGIINAPNLPPQTPALWVMLAWARRQLFNAKPTLAPVAATTDPTTGLVTGDLHASDPDGDPLTFTVVRQPANGELVIDSAAGTYTYTPRSGFAGSDTFVVTVTDGGPDGLFGFLEADNGHSSTAAITIRVPSLAADPAFTIEGTDAETGAVSGRLNVTGLDNGAAGLAVTSAPSRGAVVLNADGTFVYTPTPIARALASWSDEDVTDSFTVTVSDGFSVPRSVTVTPVVDPSLNALAYMVPADSGFNRYLLDTAVQLDPVTGRVYAERAHGDYRNYVPGQPVPTYLSLVAISPDGTVVETDEVRATGHEGTAINPVTGVGYLVSTFADPVTGVTTSHIAVITAEGDARVITAAGTAIGGTVFNAATGHGYQTIEGFDPTTGPVTHVVRFDSNGELLGIDKLTGRAVGGVVTDPVTGRAFQTTEVVLLPSNVSTTHLTVFAGDGSAVTHSGLAGKPVGQVIVNSTTGSVYQTSRIRDRITGTNETAVVVVDATGTVAHTEIISGLPIGGVVVNPLTGSVYQTTLPNIGPDDPLVTVVTAVHADGSSVTTGRLPGSPDSGVIVNPVSGTVYQLTTDTALDTLVNVIEGDGSVHTATLPGGITGEVQFNPVGDSAYVTTTNGGVTSLTIVDTAGDIRTVPGSLVGVPVLDPVTGQVFVTSAGSDGATLTIANADGRVLDSLVLGGIPRDGAGRNPVTGTIYQTTNPQDLSSTTVHIIGADGERIATHVLPESTGFGAVVNPKTGMLYQLTTYDDRIAGTLHVIDTEGTVIAHEVPGWPFPIDDNQGLIARVVANPVTGGAYLVVTDYVRPEFSPAPRAEIVVVSPDGADVTVVGESDGFTGAVVRELAVNPVTGVAYQLSLLVLPGGSGMLITSIFDDASVVVTDPLAGLSQRNPVVDPRTGTVYQVTDRGVWVVDVTPEALSVG